MRVQEVSESDAKKEHKPKFSSGVGVFLREGVGGKKFGMSLETREIKLFWRDISGSVAPEKLEKKNSVFNSRPPQRDENGGVGSVVVGNSPFWGTLIFSPEGPKH